MRKKIKYSQHIRTTNDTNGNPQRLYVGYAADGEVMRVTDEGYGGRPEWSRGLIELWPFDVTPKEYNDTLKTARARGLE